MECPVLKLFSRCLCAKGVTCLFCIQMTVVVTALVFGALLARYPKKAIEMQIAFYRLINWKMEPISMKKEIWITRIMGLTVLILAVISLICVLYFK